MKNLFILINSLLFLSANIFAQSVVDQIDGFESGFETVGPSLSTEKIEKISASGRIFILSNNSASYGKGDFISLLIDKKLVNRALVAKTTGGSGGIKIMKLYNPELHKLLRPGMEVQVIRGDDSYFKLKPKQAVAEEKGIIQDEENLFDETTLLEDDLSLEDNSNRHIKTDNIISLYLAQISGVNADSGSETYTQISGAYAYQISDNFWVELGYGQNVITDYPSGSIDTTYSNLVFKIKYTVAAPLYSYLQPYAGYQTTNATSPAAGSDGEGITEEEKQLELDLVDDLKKSGPIFGVTILKRLVPGWFARLDIGSDSLNFGFSLEF